MPYKSDAQRRWAHTDKGEKALGGPEGVHEWDEASKGKKLPEHVKKMAEGGITSGNPSDLDPGIKDATLTDFLAPLLGGMTGGEEALDPLANEAGEMGLGNAPKIPGEAEDEVTAFVKGIQKNPNGPDIKIYGVKGDPAKLKALFGDEAPGSVPESVLRDKGVLPSISTPMSQNSPNAYAFGGLLDMFKSDKSDASKAAHVDDNPPSSVDTSSGTAKGYAYGGEVEEYISKKHAPNMSSGGGIGFGHREKSGPALTKSINMADGGMTPDDFSVGNDDTTVSTPDVTKYSPVDPTALPPAAQDMPIPAAPKFNPQSGLPPVTPAPTQPMPPPGGAVNPALTQYLAQQKQAIGQYGPEQQLQVSNDILKRQNSPGSLVGQGLAGLGDAIMQGVARTGNPGFLKGVQERQQQQGTQQINALERARGANLQNVEAGQKLDAMDPSSAFSKAEQATYAPLFAKLGYKPEQLGTMSAANIQNALQLMTQFGGKQIEMMIKQFELRQKQQEINETIRSHKATEGTEQEKVGTEAAKEILNGSKIPGVPPSHEAKLGAENVLEQAAGVTKAAPYGNTTIRNGKSYTWDPESSKYYLSGNE